MHEIRRLWLYEKHEFDDSLPRIFEEVTGQEFDAREDDGNGLRVDDWELLREVCGGDQAFFDLQVALLGVERRYRGMTRRTGVFDFLEERLRARPFGNEEAIAVLKGRKERQERETRAARRTPRPVARCHRPAREHDLGRRAAKGRPGMILDKLTLRNFCLFRGKHVLDLSPGQRNGKQRPSSWNRAVLKRRG